MYLGIDVGGSKTLVAVFTKDGQQRQTVRFDTPQNYTRFLDALTEQIRSLGVTDFSAACVAMPGRIDRAHGTATDFGNLPWKNIHIVEFLEKLIKAPVLLDNDAKLAGLYEAKNIKGDFKRVLYVTISTGIGVALIVDGVIDENVGDRGGNAFMLTEGRKTVSWEKLASGKAITEQYGKRASELNDAADWKAISRNIARGLIDVISLFEPDVVVIGGGVGTHFHKFESPLREALQRYELPIMKIPPVMQARRPEEAVIFGCYELLKQRFGG